MLKMLADLSFAPARPTCFSRSFVEPTIYNISYESKKELDEVWETPASSTSSSGSLRDLNNQWLTGNLLKGLISQAVPNQRVYRLGAVGWS